MTMLANATSIAISWIFIAAGITERLPDPTVPFAGIQVRKFVSSAPTTPEEIRLSGIRISATERHAIINGRMVTTGDLVGGLTVAEIHPDYIVLDYKGKQIPLRLVTIKVKQNHQPMVLESGLP